MHAGKQRINWGPSGSGASKDILGLSLDVKNFIKEQ
jgi:hypothetical protein